MASASTPGIDMALDDIIEKKRTPRRSFNRGTARVGGAPRTFRNKSAPYARPQRQNGGQLFVGNAQAHVARPIPKGILVNNLDFKVTQEEVAAVFSQVGPVRSAQLNYDVNGRSKGSATVTFSRPNDAYDALDRFNNVLFDNRPMKLELLVPPEALSALGATTLAMNPYGSYGGASSNGGGFRRGGGFNNSRGRGNSSRGSGFRRGGRGSGGRGGSTQQEQQPSKTQQELDAEMEEYLASGDVTMN
ncbi:hypothetical protein SeMB42_g01056 [Synchytrium endobioticum]|uniref:RRM domain-containing protein n=1 Tax=Synchytrium endobioticum TaxID=286115 RepID=A0A507D8Q3_9FUNG|nr:hypothetical protein SeLEV6574_g02433 [Synchytrium endobioticum]TPX53015.1 hypothetical protein SeMB42_g01056 [Synchytrium endobioticum]